ncbi:MAG: endo alpha-1,4 polygalactosaminidase [Hyphomicrobium sp.]
MAGTPPIFRHDAGTSSPLILTGAPEAAAVPAPRPVTRPEARQKKPSPAPQPAMLAPASREARSVLMAKVKSWAAQMQDLNIEQARQTDVDLLVTDATSGAMGGRAISPEEVATLKVKPDGQRRLLISYLSIGEAEDYRPDYFTAEYMEEDAPDWLLKENEKWKGNRLIRFCEEGWQRTILGDEDGRNLYNSVEPSPLYKLIEMGFDGVYLDRVDVYSEVQKQCPDAARKMVAFVARLAAHARKSNPNFVVILQNAEELLQDKDMVNAIDAVAKEDLFYGADHTERQNDAGMIKTVLTNLAIARAAGRPVLVLDYLKDPAKRAADKAKIEALGFIPYFGPRKLDQLWLSQAGP